jgi:predicted N-acyltransferase
MFEASIHRSLADIGRERWDACFPGALEGFDYLLAVEQSGLPGFEWRYVLVEADGRPIAAAPAFITDYALDTTLNPLGRGAVAAVRRLVPRAFALRLGALGSPCTEDVGLGFAAGIDPTSRQHALQALVSAFETDALAARCGLLAIKDTPEPDKSLWDTVAQPLGFRPVTGLPTAHLDINFPDLEAYLARLSPGTRRDMRRKLRALDQVTIEVRQDLEGLEDAVLALYADTRARAQMQFEELTPAYFTGVLERMRGRAICVLYRAEGRLLAANLLLHDHQTLLDKFFCMDAAQGRALNLYFVSWFTNLRLCLDRGFTRYQSGQAGYANKLRLGSTLTATAMRFRHRNPLINQALRWAAPLLSEDPLAEAA